MFSEHAAPFGTYDMPIYSDFHVDGRMDVKSAPAPGIAWVFSSKKIGGNFRRRSTRLLIPHLNESLRPIQLEECVSV